MIEYFLTSKENFLYRVFVFYFSEELQTERDRSKTLQNEMERCFSDLQLL